MRKSATYSLIYRHRNNIFIYCTTIPPEGSAPPTPQLTELTFPHFHIYNNSMFVIRLKPTVKAQLYNYHSSQYIWLCCHKLTDIVSIKLRTFQKHTRTSDILVLCNKQKQALVKKKVCSLWNRQMVCCGYCHWENVYFNGVKPSRTKTTVMFCC